MASQELERARLRLRIASIPARTPWPALAVGGLVVGALFGTGAMRPKDIARTLKGAASLSRIAAKRKEL